MCVCVSVKFVHSVKTTKHIFKCFSPSGSHTILVFPYQTAWQYSDGKPTNGVVEPSNAGGVGRNRDSEPIMVPAASAIHLAATDHGEFITLVADKRRSLLMAGNNDEVYDKKPQGYTEDNVTKW